MSKKNNEKAEVRVEGVEQALTKAEQFLESYQKQILWVVGMLIGIVFIYMAFQHFYVEQKSQEAAAQMFPAEQYFESGLWDQALNGYGNNLGFIDIISEYKFTPSAKLSNYYAGMSYLHLGEYDEAVKYLGKFKSKDRILSSLAIGGIGDAYAELGESDKALMYYKKAAENKSNDFTTPLYLLRAGILMETEGKYKEAGELYDRIKKEYATSTEGRMIDKYIARIQANRN